MNSNRSFARLLSTPRLLAAICMAALCGHAAPLAETAAVQTRPDAGAPALGILKAGAEPSSAEVAAPAGWMSVNLPGPFEGYVQNADLTKGLDVKPGSPIYLSPSPDSGVLATAVKGDKISITGLRGKWTQVRLEKSLIGFIHLGPLPAVGQSAETPQTAAQVQPQAASAAPVAAAPSTDAGRPAVTATGERGGAASRYFEGTVVSSRRLLAPRRPYDWQLDDAAGARIAYLDVGKLLLTEQIDSYVGHTVAVFGAVNPVPGSGDIVIAVENLQLK